MYGASQLCGSRVRVVFAVRLCGAYMIRVLVFDSGVGGLSVLDAIARSGAGLELDYLADTAWLPYGGKPDGDVAARVPALLDAISQQWAPDVVVIACNTASTIALEGARARLAMPVVGVVPPIKPAAAATKSGVIGLLATPATIRRPYTQDLIARFAADKIVIRVGSTALVDAAEAKLRGGQVDFRAIDDPIAALFAAPDGEAIDVVALSCTHFPLLLPELQAATPVRACQWIESGAAVARRVVELTAPPVGHSRACRAAFTDATSAEQLRTAFVSRGFEAFHLAEEAPEQRFSLRPM